MMILFLMMMMMMMMIFHWSDCYSRCDDVHLARPARFIHSPAFRVKHKIVEFSMMINDGDGDDDDNGNNDDDVHL